ncbi:MAG: DNA polymerase III subunit delta' [Negativicutes bacterium]|nr:DNA polymerase III subunit delta' [Negativicutes bacterium]
MWSDAVFGQDYAVTLLNHAMKQQRLAQSYLFYGPEGVGKRTTALCLALAVNCLTQEGLGCGTCVSCRKLQKGSHPDWFTLQPLEGKSGISIEQIRQLQPLMAHRPYEGRRRVVVIDPIDKLEAPAANALLKLLEEPAADNLLILISHQPESILPTVRSRCQMIRFLPLSEAIIRQILQQKHPGLRIPETAVKMAQGSVGKAAAWLEDDHLALEWERAVQWFFEEPNWSVSMRLAWTAEREKEKWERINWQIFWRSWQDLLRDRLILSGGGSAARLMNPQLQQQLCRMKPLSSAQLGLRIEQISLLLQQLQARVTALAASESLLIDWRSE